MVDAASEPKLKVDVEDVPNGIDGDDLVTDDVVEAAPNEKLGGCGIFVASGALNVKVGDTLVVLSFSLSLPKLEVALHNS